MEESRFEFIQNKVSGYGCKLLTTNEQLFQLMQTNVKSYQFQKVRILSTCGHVSDGYISNLTSKGTGILCKSCSKDRTTHKQREDRVLGVKTAQEIEYEGYKHIRDILEHDFEILKANEGCQADFLLKPKKCLEDNWLMIQLKVTTKAQCGQYCYGIHKKNYDTCVMALVCLEEKKTWIMDGSIASGMSNLNIGLNKSKYDKYAITTNICEVLQTFYENKDLFSKKECMLPVSELQQREQIYRSLIHDELPFLTIELPEREGLKYDFSVNARKVQEKVCGIVTKKNGTKIYSVVLCANNGKIDGVRKFKPYKLGENDFYWIWIKDERCFYVIPEKQLMDHNLLDDTETTTRKPRLGLKWKSKTEWYSEYFYDLDNLDVDKLTKVFYSDHT